MEKEQRLAKILASSGKWSRREIKLLVRKGRVLINGKTAMLPNEKYDPENDQFIVDGELFNYRRITWLMMNKPSGVLSATEDRREATVLDLLSREYRRMGLFPVGRLDKDTEGLLFLTNDGQLAHRLLSPRHHVDKVYDVIVDGVLTEEDCAAFREGMTLNGLHCLPADLQILCSGKTSEALVTLREGKYHQVKRMLAARGKYVLFLRRIQMGNLTLDPSLPSGKYRLLTREEVHELSEMVE